MFTYLAIIHRAFYDEHLESIISIRLDKIRSARLPQPTVSFSIDAPAFDEARVKGSNLEVEDRQPHVSRDIPHVTAF